MIIIIIIIIIVAASKDRGASQGGDKAAKSLEQAPDTQARLGNARGFFFFF